MTMVVMTTGLSEEKEKKASIQKLPSSEIITLKDYCTM